jgi:hypothetical protein
VPLHFLIACGGSVSSGSFLWGYCSGEKISRPVPSASVLITFAIKINFLSYASRTDIKVNYSDYNDRELNLLRYIIALSPT